VPSSEGLKPRLGGFRFDVAEAVRKRRGSTFYLSKDSFDSIPISSATHLKSETSPLQRSLEVFRAIGEKFGCLNIVFVSEFAQEDLGECGRGRRKETDVKQLVCCRISSGVQPEFFIVDPNHRFVERDLIR